MLLCVCKAAHSALLVPGPLPGEELRGQGVSANGCVLCMWCTIVQPDSRRRKRTVLAARGAETVLGEGGWRGEGQTAWQEERKDGRSGPQRG